MSRSKLLPEVTLKQRLTLRATRGFCGVMFSGVLLLSAGCGDGSAKLSASDANAFASASADLKQQWEKALAADKAKDYATAQTLLDALSQQQLNAAQKQALQTERAEFGQRLLAAVEKNNPAAIKAIQDSQNQNRRPK